MSARETRRVSVRTDAFDVYMGRADWTPPGFTGEGADGYFGNPVGTLDAFRPYFERRVEADGAYRARIEGLRGRRLGCWCRTGKDCHVDIIVDWMERSDESGILSKMAERLGNRNNPAGA